MSEMNGELSAAAWERRSTERLLAELTELDWSVSHQLTVETWVVVAGILLLHTT